MPDALDKQTLLTLRAARSDIKLLEKIGGLMKANNVFSKEARKLSQSVKDYEQQGKNSIIDPIEISAETAAVVEKAVEIEKFIDEYLQDFELALTKELLKMPELATR
jgi:hypothetical protein